MAVLVPFLYVFHLAVPAGFYAELGYGRSNVYLDYPGVNSIAGQGILDGLGPLAVIGGVPYYLVGALFQYVHRRQLPAAGCQHGLRSQPLPHLLYLAGAPLVGIKSLRGAAFPWSRQRR